MFSCLCSYWNPKFTLFISYIRESEFIKKSNRFNHLTVSPVCETFHSSFAIGCFLCLFYFVPYVFIKIVMSIQLAAMWLANSRLFLSGAFLAQVHCHDWQLPVLSTLVRQEFLPRYWDCSWESHRLPPYANSIGSSKFLFHRNNLTKDKGQTFNSHKWHFLIIYVCSVTTTWLVLKPISQPEE